MYGHHWKAQQSFKQDGHSSFDYTILHQKLIRNTTSLQVHAFLGYSQTGTEENEATGRVEGNILWLPCLNASVGTGVNFLTGKEAWDGHRQKLHADTYGRLLVLKIKQWTGKRCLFVEYLLEKSSRREQMRTFSKCANTVEWR